MAAPARKQRSSTRSRKDRQKKKKKDAVTTMTQEDDDDDDVFIENLNTHHDGPNQHYGSSNRMLSSVLSRLYPKSWFLKTSSSSSSAAAAAATAIIALLFVPLFALWMAAKNNNNGSAAYYFLSRQQWPSLLSTTPNNHEEASSTTSTEEPNTTTIVVPDADPVMRTFLTTVCAQSDVHCHEDLIPAGRTQAAAARTTIYANSHVLEIPRRLQLWDLDALRDDFVRTELLSARIVGSGGQNNPLMAGAFLAAYLAWLTTPNAATSSSINLLNPILQMYVTTVLPSHDDLATYHPVFWTEEVLDESLGGGSSTYNEVHFLRHELHDEYDAFVMASPTAFGRTVDRGRYLAARVCVMSRGFTTPWQRAGEGPDDGHKTLIGQDELSFYRETAGLDFSQSQGFHAMVPVLDQYDHHAKPNVQLAFQHESQSFRVVTARDILPGSVVTNSYGRRTDSEMFARYGFVNGDGSEWTQANLAIHHTVFPYALNGETNIRISHEQALQMVRYLEFDDGYEECIGPGSTKTTAWELKRIKYAFLFYRANLSHLWQIAVPPRNPDSLPAPSINVPITLEAPMFKAEDIPIDINTEGIFAICRVITVTDQDYNGMAASMLRENFQDTTYFLPTHNPGDDDDALLKRTLSCVERMASTALDRFGGSLMEQLDYTVHLNRHAYRSRNWTLAHLQLGEMQSLHAVRQAAMAELNNLRTNHSDDDGNEPCGREFLDPLLTR